MKLVGLQFHQSGGNRQFKKAQSCRADQRLCYPDLNLAPIPAWFKTPRFWVTNGPWAGLREKVDGVRGCCADQFLEKRE
jgi:hypothetical protein